MTEICKICKKEMCDIRALSYHISRIHKTTPEDYYIEYLNKEKGLCKICKNPTKFLSIELGYRPYCSAKCVSKDDTIKAKVAATTMEKYGVANISKRKDIAKKAAENRRLNSLKKYGVDSPMKVESIAAKAIDGKNKKMMEKYGTTNATQVKEIDDKRRESYIKYCQENKEEIRNRNLKILNDYKLAHNGKMPLDEINEKQRLKAKENAAKKKLEKFGTEQIMKVPAIKNKSIKHQKEFNNKNYNVDYRFQNKELLDNALKLNKEACLQKYGCTNILQNKNEQKRIMQQLSTALNGIHPMKVPSIKNKFENTCLKKFGVPYAISPKHILKYDNATFDSSWELAFYIYHKDQNHDIIRNNDEYLIYSLYNIDHKYYPDFIYNNQYIEIKGDQFIDENNNLINPFKEDKEKSDAKFKCMKDNNVIILTGKDLKEILNYVYNKYNDKNWYKQYLIQDTAETHKT